METLNFDITFLPFSSNYLVHLDPKVFSALPSLKHLDLAHNFLMSLPQPFFQVPIHGPGLYVLMFCMNYHNICLSRPSPLHLVCNWCTFR